MSVVDLARELGTTDRTLRRLAEVGTIHSGRPRAGLRKVLQDEETYLRDHWHLLSALRAALRTEPKVIAALLFGSNATGADLPESDVDLVVAMEGEPTLRELNQLRRRIATRIGRPVDLFNLEDLAAETDRLVPVIDQARPIVDRAYVWPRLVAYRRRLARARPMPGSTRTRQGRRPRFR
jgi:predicted nucleotidyltransferase